MCRLGRLTDTQTHLRRTLLIDFIGLWKQGVIFTLSSSSRLTIWYLIFSHGAATALYLSPLRKVNFYYVIHLI